MEYETSFKDLITRIDLIDYVKSLGYKENKTKSTSRQQMFDNGYDKILILKHRESNDLIYQSVHHSADKGNIINFVANRLGGILNTAKKSKQDYKEVAEILKKYSGSPIEKKEKPSQANAKSETKNYYFNLKLFKPESLKNTDYLESRGIKKETIFSNHFRGKIINCQEYDFKEKINYGKVKTGFLISDESNNNVGLDMRDIDFKKFALGSNRSESFFVSNKLENQKTLVLAESPLDLLSYHQIKGSDENRYYSTNGNITGYQLETLKKIVKDKKYDKLILATDNDFAGYYLDLKLLQKLDSRIKSVSNNEHFITIQINTEDYQRIFNLLTFDECKNFINQCLAHKKLDNVIFFDKAPSEHKDWNAVINPNENKNVKAESEKAELQPRSVTKSEKVEDRKRENKKVIISEKDITIPKTEKPISNKAASNSPSIGEGRGEALIPSKIAGYTLKDIDKERLTDNGIMPPRIFKGKEGYFMASVKLTDDKEGVEFFGVVPLTDKETVTLLPMMNGEGSKLKDISLDDNDVEMGNILDNKQKEREIPQIIIRNNSGVLFQM